MEKNILTKEAEQELRMALRRCRPEVIEAAVAYRAHGEKEKAVLVVMGIIERFLEPESRPKLHDEGAEEYRLIEDLGVDSLVMVEIVMTIEEVLQISIPNEDLKELATIIEVKNYIQARINNIERTPQNANA